jgi:hypothetical protein
MVDVGLRPAYQQILTALKANATYQERFASRRETT